MIFYHGTTDEIMRLILKEGVLWGKHGWGHDSETYRYTYLTPYKHIAQKYGNVILEIAYTIGSLEDNYREGCDQFSVFDPIPLTALIAEAKE